MSLYMRLYHSQHAVVHYQSHEGPHFRCLVLLGRYLVEKCVLVKQRRQVEVSLISESSATYDELQLRLGPVGCAQDLEFSDFELELPQ